MNTNVAIRVENISKRYLLGENLGQSRGVLESIRQTFTRLSGASGRAPQGREFWALRDVSFQINAGEIVGIIGRNGAGKSTLLKILSRIVRPTSGRAVASGRMGSLLEVGTGFHPELTGRENIFLNGAVLGMRRTEISRRFDEIVAFSEVERFLDTPVKRYSSGMYVRLAFAVAAHLEPEILVVDEVLAVGDASFQKRCLNKMEDVQKDGRTVIFVSHSMSSITRLCPRAIMLEKGSVVADGPSAEIVRRYLQGDSGSTCAVEFPDLASAPGDDVVRLLSLRVLSDGAKLDTVDIRQPVQVEMRYQVLSGERILIPNLHFYNEEGICAFISPHNYGEWRERVKPPGVYQSVITIPGNFLSEGTYFIGAAVSTSDPVTVHFWEKDAIAFQVVDSSEGDSVRGDYAGVYPGVIRPRLDWLTEQVAESQTLG